MTPDLPEGWDACEIGEVARVVGGGTPPSKDPSNFASDDGVPWLTPADLSGYGKMYIEGGARALSGKGYSSSSAAILPTGSVLFSSRAPIGYVVIAANPISTNQGFKSFVLYEGIDSRFVYFYLRHIKPIAEQRATGTTFKELSGAAAARLPLVVAPVNEQQRIADKLDTLLARVDACRERLDRVPTLLKRFRQSVLAAATSGALTADWREESESDGGQASAAVDGPLPVPAAWRWAQFGEFSSSFRSGTSAVPTDNLTPFPVLRSSSVRPRHVNLSDVRYLSAGQSVRKDDFLVEGELLFTRLSGSLEYVANCARVPALSGRQIQYPDRLFRARLSDPAWGPYLELCFSSPALREFLEVESKSTAGHQRISMGAVTSFPIPVPRVAERDEIVRRVDLLVAFADRLEASYTAARTHTERLTPALLAKAFRGELVPQDPADEPASVLLERIRAARAAEATRSSGRGQRK